MRRMMFLLCLLLVLAASAYAEAHTAYNDDAAQWGVINEAGQWRAVPELADAASVSRMDEGICEAVTADGDMLWYDVTYGRTWRLLAGWELESWTDKTILVACQQGGSGLWDRARAVWLVEPGGLPDLTVFNDGAAIIDHNGGYAFVHEADGRIVPWPEGLAPVDFCVDDGIALAMDEQGRVGYLKITGDMLIEPQFESGGFFQGDLAIVTLMDGTNALINREGRVVAELDESVSVIPCGEWADGGIALDGDGCWLVIGPDGTVRFRHPFESGVDGRFILTGAPTAENGSWWVLYSWDAGGAYAGLMTAEGEWVVQPEIYLPGGTLDGDALQRIKQEGLYGYVDGFGEIVIPCQFAHADAFCGPLAWVKWPDGCKGYIDRDGRTVYAWENE